MVDLNAWWAGKWGWGGRHCQLKLLPCAMEGLAGLASSGEGWQLANAAIAAAPHAGSPKACFSPSEASGWSLLISIPSLLHLELASASGPV